MPNIKSAASGEEVPANNELHIVNPPNKYKMAYPLSTFSYVIVPKSTSKKTLLSKFISYALTRGQGSACRWTSRPCRRSSSGAGIATVRKFQAG